MSVKKSLAKNLGAGIWSRSSTILFRLIQVPLIISVLGVEDYGRWLVLYSLPSWLTLANMGFGSVASNEMVMSVANGDMTKARQVFSTALAIIAMIGLGCMIIISAGAFFVPWEHFLKADASRHTEFSFAVIYLALTIFISFSSEVFGGRFRAARKAHLRVVLTSFLPWISLLGMVIILQFTKRFDYLALSQLIATIIFFFIYQWTSWRVLPDLSFSVKQIQFSHSKFLLKKGVAFQAFPLGNALIFQGNIIIVQSVLGPGAVALFGTARTLVRTINQAMEMINQAIWPEMSHLFGAKNFNKAAKLHRTGVMMSISLSLIGLIVLSLFGKTLYGFWVGKSMELPQYLLLLFLLPIPFNALWLTSSVVHMASNRHEGLAVRYLIATVISAIACAILSYTLGIEGAAFSTLIADVILIPYVLKRSLDLTKDNSHDFYAGVWKNIKEIPFTTNKLIKRLKRG